MGFVTQGSSPPERRRDRVFLQMCTNLRRRTARARLRSAVMSQIAFVFPGQGSQFVGMGRGLAETSPAAAAVFATADEALGEHHLPPRLGGSRGGPQPDRERAAGAPRRLDRLPRGRPRALERTRGGHPGPRLRRRPLDGPVHGARRRRRTRPRRRRPPGAHPRPADAGVGSRPRGPDGRDHRPRRRPAPGPRRPGVRVHGIFGVANRNSPGQVVVSGERPAVEAALASPKTLGAKRAIELPVSVAAHSPLMAEAADGMRAGPRRDRLPRPEARAPRQRRRPPHHHGGRLPGGARGPPHHRRRLGRRSSGRCTPAASPRSSRSGPAASSPASSGASRPTS